eukprot:14856263-Ditylum_brightwellii.AAC.1
MAYTQANAEFDLYMRLPKGVEVADTTEPYLLKLLKNLYGSRQAGKVWADHLKKGLTTIDFQPSLIDDCLWYRDDVIFMFYVDDRIFVSPDDKQIQQTIKDLQEQSFEIDERGTITDYLGINFEWLPDVRLKMSQPHLIHQIIDT